MKGTKSIENSAASFILLVFSIVFFLFFSRAFGAIPASERAALIALYNSTNGDNWDRNYGWKAPPLAADGFAMPGTEYSWHGIHCNTTGTAVKGISLSRINLHGTLPPELGNLSKLEYLDISAGDVTGSIPPELGKLTKLQTLRFYLANVTGSIPPELGNLSNLRYFDFHFPNLTGTIPPELGNLGKLETFKLDRCKLTGSIPPELGNLTNLEILEISRCDDLTGSIPPELSNLTNLKRFEISECKGLSGGIPPELGNLANLQSLYLRDTPITGRIPPELGNLANLTSLGCSGCGLTGPIPPELGSLFNLVSIGLHNNALTGPIPGQLGNLTQLRALSLYENNLGGSIPASLGNLSELTSLRLAGNNLSGAIPPELGNFSNLWELDLSSNNLEGGIPPELGNLSNVFEMYLDDNKLSGPIPAELGNLTEAAVIYLHSNRLSGSLPDNLQTLARLGETFQSYYYGLSLCWNALYSDNDTLREFIDGHHDDMCVWESKQTMPPTGLTASTAGPGSIDLKWTPIAYKEDPGSYRVFYSTSEQGPFEFIAETADKYASGLTVTGLKPGTTYYFKIKTRTNPHTWNKNAVDSEASRVVSASTLAGYVSISGTITHRGSGLPGVTLTLSNNGGTVTAGAKGYYYAWVESGWSGTIIPSRGNYLFTPAQRTYKEVYSEQTDQDFTAFIPITLHIGVERKTERAFIISRDYAVITLSMENKSNIQGIRCMLERKVKGDIFQSIKEFAGTELSSGAYVYTDKFLDRDKAYSYRLAAYDSEGNHLVSSDEATINNVQQGLLEGGKKNEGTGSKEK